jgi:1-acyl-sn-glycerol-3-phosphate acyltransferase
MAMEVEASRFDSIRPFYDSEVNAAVRSISNDPMLAGIMRYGFPNMEAAAWQQKLEGINSTQEFQGQIVAKILERVLADTSEGLTTSGFDQLDKNKAYLFISNHRDIILDTSLINLSLFNHGLILTASAIGDNLVKMPFLHTLSRINRNFLVQRGLSPRELLQSSKLMSEYIAELVRQSNRSVWLAQREGRTKDGNDATHPGILKMLSMAAGKEEVVGFFKSLNIVPISISYEYDPTDALKIPELLANLNNEKYVKAENEDFNSMFKGIMGQKKHIHIHAGDLMNAELDSLTEGANANQQIKTIAQLIDGKIIGNYRLWPTNYMAYDVLHNTNKFENQYTLAEKQAFFARMEQNIDGQNAQSVEHFLAMYANPVANKEELSAV